MDPDEDLLVHKEERARLKGEYKKLFLETSALLFRHNPIGLDFETNIDEYDPEVGTVLPRLSSCGSPEDVQRVLHEEFTRWFSPHDAGPPERYRAPTLELRSFGSSMNCAGETPNKRMQPTALQF